MACVMSYCMRIQTAERPCELAHSMHLRIIFLRKELYATILDLFLTHAIFMMAKF